MTDLVGRLLHPAVIASVVIAGAAYGWLFLWALDLRSAVRLYGIAVVPGLVFLPAILLVRAGQGVDTTVYELLIVNWLLFGHAAYAAVVLRRRAAKDG